MGVLQEALKRVYKEKQVDMTVNNEWHYELKHVELAGDEFILFGGDGISLKWFFASQENQEILNEIKTFFRGIDIHIDLAEIALY